MHRRIPFIAVSLACFAGCGPKRPVHPQPDTNPLIEGRAKVLEVHNELGYALLEIKGKQTYGYWTSDPATGQIIANNPAAWNQAIADDKPPIVHHQDFPAHPGDTIAFRGMMVRQDLYLRGVAVVSK